MLTVTGGWRGKRTGSGGDDDAYVEEEEDDLDDSAAAAGSKEKDSEKKSLKEKMQVYVQYTLSRSLPSALTTCVCRPCKTSH